MLKSNKKIVKNGQKKMDSKKSGKAKKSNGERSNAASNAVFESAYDRSVLVKGPVRSGKQPLLSTCALKYAMSIARPFSVEAQGACIPSMPAQDTHKVSGFVRGDGVIGTAGVGWILISPSVANDAPTLFYTTSAYTSSTVIPVGASTTALNTGVATLAVNNLPYSAQLLTTQAGNDFQLLRGRVVSCGLSIQYTGTALNESGMVYLCRDPNHNNISLVPGLTATPLSLGTLGSYAYTELCPFTREKCFVADFASRYDELNFPEYTSGSTVPQITTLACYPYAIANPVFPNSLGSTSNYQVSPVGVSLLVSPPTVAIMVTGVAGQSFHFEYTVHAEYVGQLAQASITPSDSDERGAAEVMVAANQVGMRKVASPKASYWDLLYEGLSFAAKRAAPVVIPALEKAALALLA